MALIKATQVPASATAFSMADIESAARGMLLRARQQADQLLAAAQTEGERIKVDAKTSGLAEGRAQGLAAGMAEGRQAGEQKAFAEHRAGLQKAIEALNLAAHTLNTSRAELESDALQEVVKLSIAIARRITRREGLLEPRVLIDNLSAAMALVMQHVDLRIAIHPTQKKTIDDALPQLWLKWPSLKHVEIVTEETVSPGGCRIFTRQGMVDADLGAQLDRVVDDLLPIPSEEGR